ncbi:reverse transcriptase domain-containing protein [Tanacetum coccineum]
MLLADIAKTFDKRSKHEIESEEVFLRRGRMKVFGLHGNFRRSLPFFNTLKNITNENKDEYTWTDEAEEAFQQIKKLILDLPSLITPLPKETYRTLNEAEKNYAPMEKLALSLLHMTYSGESTESYFRTLEIVPEEDDTKAWTLFMDDTSSIKGSEVSLVLIGPNSVEHTYTLRLNFDITNIEAEYEALLAGLRITKKMKVHTLEAKVDSKLIASQINEDYVASSDRMVKYLAKAREHIACFKNVFIQNIPRNQNKKD